MYFNEFEDSIKCKMSRNLNEAKKRKLQSAIEESQKQKERAIRLSNNTSIIEGITLLRFDGIDSIDAFERVVHALDGKVGVMGYIPVSDLNRDSIFRPIYSIFTKKSSKIKRRFLYESGYIGLSQSGDKMICLCAHDGNSKEAILHISF